MTIGATTRFTLSGWIGRIVFQVLRKLARLGAKRTLTALSGTLVMVSVAGFWIGGTWTGWSLIHLSTAGSVVMVPDGIEPDSLDYAAHAGQLLSTLGGGRTQAGSLVWSLVSVLIGVNGMVVLTLSVSFLLSVRQTVQQGRTFAMLEDVGALPPGESLGRLAELVAGLHAAPYALWYGNPRKARQLPAAMLSHAEEAAAAGGEHWVRTRGLLADLPHLDADAAREDLLDALEDWADRHTIARIEEAQAAQQADAMPDPSRG